MSELTAPPTSVTSHLVPPRASYALVPAAYLLQMLAILGGAVVAAMTAYSPTTFFDFDNLLRLEGSGWWWMLILGLLPVGLFLVLQWTSQYIGRQHWPVVWRGGAMLAAALVTFGVGAIWSAAAPLNLAVVVGFGLLVVALFDFLTDRFAPGFGWTLLALVLLSGLIAYLMYDMSQTRDERLRADYAHILATERDTATAEVAVVRLQNQIQRDPRLATLLQPWPFKPSADTIRNHLNRVVYKENYLFQHYRLQVYAFDRDEEAPLLLDQAEPRSTVLNWWERAQALTPDVRMTHAPDGSHRYLLHIRALRMGDATHPADLYCALDRVYPEPTQVYAQLFYNQPFMDMDRLARYDFAVVHDGRVVAEQGRVNPVAYAASIPPGTTREMAAAGRIDAVSRSADGHVMAVVGRPATSPLKAVYLLSILFTLATLGLFVLGGLLGVLPRQLTLLPSSRGSLARRIHFSILALLAVGFLVIGGLTYRHFNVSAREADQQAALYRAETLRTHLRLAGGDLTTQSDSIGRILSPALQRAATSISVDANLYAADGQLLFTTRDDLRRIGILSLKLDPATRTALADSQTDGAEKIETIQNQEFTVRYLTLRNRQNQLLGYLGVPYRTSTDSITPEVSGFIGMLASIYVFLLLVAVGATYYLSRSITRPVNQIADKIRELQLQDRNQPLAYDGDPDDELGELVGSYNRMVDQLEDSKDQLVRLERESAWREMARQIAHDIKNPLTTMKLSMQQLERVSNDPTQAAAYLKRATGRLIEQIDSLAQTASEFSMFAQLDINQKADTTINNIVESVYDLFSEQHDAILEIELPKEPYHIRADKNHLLRVFNNLVINAIQAIPSDRKGKVRIGLNRVGNNALVRISDNGGGIPVEIRDRVFEPNFTTKTTGSGLGLAICKRIIEAHDGTIRFETRDDEGTDFFVELPIVQ
jgi:two-component system, NtrC family, nitrogen regulation sensor histidine kinase NtrY